MEDSSIEESDDCDNDIANAIPIMLKTQHLLHPLTKESNLEHKWFAIVYPSKRKKVLFVVKLLRRFLMDKDGPADKFLMRCLAHKLNSCIILEDTLKDPSLDEGVFNVSQFIAGPLEVIPKGSSHSLMPDYVAVLHNFQLLGNEKENFFWKTLARCPSKCG